MDALSPFARLVRQQPLTRWITAAVVLVALVSTSGYFVLVERFARANATLTASSALGQIAWQMRDQLDRGMSDHYEQMVVLAGLHDFRPGASPDQVRSVLGQVKTSYPTFTWVGYADKQGVVLAATHGLLEGKNVAARPWFKGALSGPFVGDLHEAVLLQKLLPHQEDPWRFVDVAVPIRDEGGIVRNVLGAHMSWTWARELRRTLLAPVTQRYGVDIFVVDAQGQVLLGPKGTEGQGLAWKAYGAWIPTLAANPIQTWDDGVAYATSVVPTQGHGRYPGLGWVVVARQPQTTALADYERLRHQLIAGALLTAMLAMVGAPLVARRLSRPLMALTKALDQRAQGEQVPIPKPNAYREANQLWTALNEFTERERQHQGQLREANDSLERRIAARTVEIQQREQELRAIIEQTDEAFIRINGQGEVIEWNLHAEETFGWRRDEAVGARLGELIIPPDLRQAHLVGLERYMRSGEGRIVDRRIELPALRKDGETIQVEMVVSATRHQGEVTFNAFLHDIGERKRHEALLREGRERLRAITDNIPALIAEVDRQLCYRFANQAYLDWFGVDPQTLVGQHLSVLYGADAVAQWAPHVEQVWQGQRVQFERVRVVDGHTRHELATYLPQFAADGSVDGFYALVSDQTSSKELELRLQSEAAHDALTGLPNRRHLMAQLPQAMARANRLQQPLALLFMDLNGFKAVNDTHGHEAGDELLQQVAFRLQGVLRKGDTVVRLAGDEFVVLLEPIKGGLIDAQLVSSKIDEEINRPFGLTQATVHVSVSTGISMYDPGHPVSVEQLLSGADAAMYAAKKQRKGEGVSASR